MLSLLLLCILRFAHDRRYCAYSGLSRKKNTEVCSLWSCSLFLFSAADLTQYRPNY